MENMKIDFASVGECKQKGYFGEIIDFTISKQLFDVKTWDLLVNQFRIHSDDDNDWRGEFWGKMMRGGALMYRATGNAKLYSILVATINDLLTTQEDNGRISSYPIEKEFNGWDMWARKYVMLGLLYFLEVCKSESFKEKIIKSLKKQADYIVKHIGTKKNQKDIFLTSQNYGGLNSCSILEPFVKLYKLTNEQKYFDFAKYIVDSGFCKDMNLIKLCLTKELYPYQFTHRKAYEMMSCFEGLLELYKITKNEDYLLSVENFVDMIEKTDFTIVGGSGCESEFLDNSTEKQTEFTEDIMQETCVSVTFSKLCAKLLSLTGKSKYADIIETISYNILMGAVNNENQTMKRADGLVWSIDSVESVPHESFPFDSYSPIFQGRRGRRVAGFKVLQDGRSYGCCACISSASIAIIDLIAIMKDENGFYVNLYNTAKFISKINDKKVSISIKANLYNSSSIKFKVNSDNNKFSLCFRIPKWSSNLSILIDGQKVDYIENNGYANIEKVWNNNEIEIKMDMPLISNVKNGKVAFSKGPVVFTRDERFDDITKPLNRKFKDGKRVVAKKIKNCKFNTNVTIQMRVKEQVITLCDYAQAGKNYDDEHCNITVWQEMV